MTKQTKEKIYYFIPFLKAMAALLIINSHYDQIYPISALATGGAIGNAVFFAISGFCLYPISERFSRWITNKLIKLYVPTLIMTVIALLLYRKGELQLDNFILIIVWPTFYWFIGAIVIFYLLYYLLREVETNQSFVKLAIILAILYAGYYIFLIDKSEWTIEAKGLNSIESYFKLIYYFAAMMIGKWFRINVNKIFQNKLIYSLGMVISFISIYVVKFLLINLPKFLYWQFLNQISVLLFVIFVFLFFLSIENRFKDMSRTKFYSCANYISNIMLYLYLVQFMVIEYSNELLFPINFIIATVFILIFASVLSRISNKIILLIENII